MRLARAQPAAATAATIEATPESYRERVPSPRARRRARAARRAVRARTDRYTTSAVSRGARSSSRPAGRRSRCAHRTGGRNTVSIATASHIEIRNLVLDGRGLEVAGVRAEYRDTLAHHITIENLTIVGHGPSSRPSASPPPRRRVLDDPQQRHRRGRHRSLPRRLGRCRAVRLRAHRGQCDRGTTGYNLQIKHQKSRPLLRRDARGASSTTLRGNVFAKTATSATGKHGTTESTARPLPARRARPRRRVPRRAERLLRQPDRNPDAGRGQPADRAQSIPEPVR